MGTQRIVCLDPGHGGNDPGAVNTSLALHESDLTLLLAQTIESMWSTALIANTELLFTHLDNNLVSLVERVRISNDAKADLFISMHFNSADNAEAEGFESWHCKNSVAGGKFASVMHSRMAQVLSRQGHKDRGIKQSQFYVLLHTEAPAALLEYEFISNEKQALWLSTYDTICLLARATIDGIRDAVHRMDGSS